MASDGNSAEEIILKNINDLKKKIQLSEGQRKAKFEICGIEKKKNADKINQLKNELKELCANLGKPIKSEEIFNQRAKSAKGDFFPLSNKRPDEALNVIEYRIIELNKKLDMLVYQYHKFEEKYENLLEFRDELKAEAEKFQRLRRKSAEKTPDKQRTSELENKIHHTELNAMEAETVRRKYSSIRVNLLNDSVKYEASLQKLENDIRAQSDELEKLQNIRIEALHVRDATRAMLVRQEELAIRQSKERERKLQEQRMVVEERRLELENLEHQLFPSSGVMPQLHRDSVTSLDNLGLGAPNEDNHSQYSTSALEDTYKKLMVATGEVEPSMVTHRFVSQKETRNRLTYLRGLTEEDKRKMEAQRTELMAKLEASKFTAEVKSKELNAEEVEELKIKIVEEEKRCTNTHRKVKERKATKERVMKCLLEIYNSLEEFDTSENKFDTKGKDLDHIALLFIEDAILAAHKLAQQKQEEQRIRERASHSRLGSRAGYTHRSSSERTEIQQNNQKSKEVESEEEDIPTRNFIKRQAQMIVDSKSRRRFFRPGRSRMTMQMKKM
ncbi:outer dynein arm-docking complex subunit 3 [Neocloeon triangulifer]|uniref:outer dynein arm-docking complex subunit 3 n=1 Tax=Neocloeon triangulifer TaxID=2078957 RepID=UPI00286EBD37|nr:outer dynein arm-docking complex subunit 3 [Neocloeon triangulifer]